MEVVPKDAATTMVVRDTASGLEVLMLRRNSRSAWASSIHLFPGGAVDDDDRSAEMARLCTGRDDAGASELLGVEAGGLGHFVAAIRECYEEAGILLARHDGIPLSLHDRAMAERFERWRRALNRNEVRFADIAAAESLSFALDELGYVAHWITPEGEPRRYDTRFFVAVLPDGQEALHDDVEVVASGWIRPEEALSRGARGEIELWAPTMKNLEAIARFSTAAEVMAAAERASVQTVIPRLVEDEGGMRIVLPGDEGYEQ